MSTCRSRSYRGALNKFVPVFKSKFSHRVWLGRALVSGVKRWYNGVTLMSVVSLVMITRHPRTQEHSHMSDMTNISINIRYLLQDVEWFISNNGYFCTQERERKMRTLFERVIITSLIDAWRDIAIWSTQLLSGNQNHGGWYQAVIRALNEQLDSHDVPGGMRLFSKT